MQALYPILTKAPILPLWQGADMEEEEPFFDVELLKAEAKKQGFTQNDLAKVAGITSQSAVSNIFKGKRRVKVEEAEAMYRFLGLTRPKPEPRVQFIPLIGLASAGAWREAIRDSKRDYPIHRGSVGKNAFAVQVVGDSMDRVIPDGGIVIIDPDQIQLYDKRSYLIRNECGEVTIKQYRADPARFEPLSRNKEHKPLPIGQEQFTILGRAVHTVGDL